MQELRRRILEEREATADKVVPSAFVTFKCGPTCSPSLVMSRVL
jgi:hypothetical protein